MESSVNLPSSNVSVLEKPKKSRSYNNLKEELTNSENAKFDEDNDFSTKKIKIGVCAMEKKVDSKPMREILRRLAETQEFEIEIFKETIIFEVPIEGWPIVNCLISFFSKDFPMAKVMKNFYY